MADQQTIHAAAGMDGGVSGAAPANEEIEIELIRRKETLHGGGAQ